MWPWPFKRPAFAGDVKAAKTEADCKKAGGMWYAATNTCAERCKPNVRFFTAFRRSLEPAFGATVALSGPNFRLLLARGLGRFAAFHVAELRFARLF